VNSAAQRAGIAALKGPQNDVWQMVEEYRRRRDVLIEGICKIPGFSIVPPRGAFYAFVNIKDWGMTSVQVAEKLLKEVQVATTPGSAFGDSGEGYLRISFASNMQDIKEALGRLWREYF